ncbi:MAG: hypothetical protein M1828_000445 [Chrysothrix sp. TS-e1954]|nr:MAG: hypothetical protein M1828_000445 [Chrysothrix sp. TS-e1954]
MVKHDDISAVYVALEDFLEQGKNKKLALLSHTIENQSSPLRTFIALPDNQLLILGPRRIPPVTSPVPNRDESVSIMTSDGFQFLSAVEYSSIAEQIRPDVMIGLGDISFGAKPGIRKLDKMFTRTERWTKQLIETSSNSQDKTNPFPAVFAPILPVSLDQQRWYLDLLEEDLRHRLAGLAIYDADNLVDLPASLSALPRLCMTQPRGPRETLREIAQGADLLTLPFVNDTTDAGIAFDFVFPCPPRSTRLARLPLGHDMWSENHAMSLESVVKDCSCYTCVKHHRAYVHHLLSVKEMLAWVLLQIHNMHIISLFFKGVRKSISGGTFEEDRARFGDQYVQQLPERTGKGPRLRGYQFKSEGPRESKKNEASFRSLNDDHSQAKGSSDLTAPLPDSAAHTNEHAEQGRGLYVDKEAP